MAAFEDAMELAALIAALSDPALSGAPRGFASRWSRPTSRWCSWSRTTSTS
ncbi:hypothetical protein [Nannocystis pusilla]|uniref:hypothetical protein n=1 Tax=Nannocystis pusilla TaxID=889268 RepID=UPI003B8008F8